MIAVPPFTNVTVPFSTVATLGSLVVHTTSVMLAPPTPSFALGSTEAVSAALSPGLPLSDDWSSVTPVACVFTNETYT